MTLEDFYLLQSPAARAAIQSAEGQDPQHYALHHRGGPVPAPLVATQLKYRARAQEKMPSWYAAGCLFEGQAFEQASSEALTELKPWGTGSSALDLTCGMGVDAFALARQYEEVTALEPDRLRYVLARHNFGMLEAYNITLHHSDAASWLAAVGDTTYDLVYLDPDRRDEGGRRMHGFAHCSPNVLELLPTLLKIAPRVLLKASPMLDIDAAVAELGQVRGVTVLSVDNECKELLFELGDWAEGATEPLRTATFLRKGRVYSYSALPGQFQFEPHRPDGFAYVYEADVALYKAGLVPDWFAAQMPELTGGMAHPEGYFFSAIESPDFPGRAYRVVEAMPWKPDQVRKYLEGAAIAQINLSRRYFDVPLDQVRAQLKIKEGGTNYLLLTRVMGDSGWERMAFHAQRFA